MVKEWDLDQEVGGSNPVSEYIFLSFYNGNTEVFYIQEGKYW